MTILIVFLFFLISAKKKLDFINFHFVFSTSIYSPHSHPDSPHSYPNFPHSHLHPHIPTLILIIPTLNCSIPTTIPPIPTMISHSPRIPTLTPCFSILIPSIFIIPFILFTDSSFRLLQIATFLSVTKVYNLLYIDWNMIVS